MNDNLTKIKALISDISLLEWFNKYIDSSFDDECYRIALDGAGVDNWEGFDFAMEDYRRLLKEEAEEED